MRRPVICIAGPTASGKSDFALRVARAVDGEVVNADALQVYRDIRLLSARPTASEMDGIPHHLFGHVAGTELYSTGQWLRDVVPVLRELDTRGKAAVLVGGTGLYFQALLQGLADIPAVEPAVQSVVDGMDVAALREEAERADPVAAARVLGAAPQRLGRIVAVHRQTGRALSDWQADTVPVVAPEGARRVVILPDRPKLYSRIDARFDRMMEAGALEEAAAVHEGDYPDRAPLLKAIGLSHLLGHLRGEMTFERAVELAKRDTRRFAKRQMTWFRNRCADWTVLSSDADRAAFLRTLAEDPAS